MNAEMPAGHEVVFYLSRLPAAEVIDYDSCLLVAAEVFLPRGSC